VSAGAGTSTGMGSGAATADDRTVAEAALDALNLGAAAGRVGARQATAALAGALAHSPGMAARTGRLARDLSGAVAGRTVATPGRGDARFADPAWRDHPLYRRLGQAYLAVEGALADAVAEADVDWRTAERARFAAGVLTSALAPTNTLAGNPAALKRAFDTAGLSLLRGGRNLLADARAGQRTPRQVDTRPFQVGGNLAATPGDVVFRNDSEWVQARSGARRRAPAEPGSTRFPSILPAPGRYVTEK
jgi:polyhydroxyalkanoate synthase subunit PhaC